MIRAPPRFSLASFVGPKDTRSLKEMEANLLSIIGTLKDAEPDPVVSCNSPKHCEDLLHATCRTQ
jgi:hypothetical protein